MDATFLDPFAGNGFHLDGWVASLGDLSAAQDGLSISANMQHTWRINPAAAPSGGQGPKMCTDYGVEGQEQVPCDNDKSTWDQNTLDLDNTMD